MSKHANITPDWLDQASSADVAQLPVELINDLQASVDAEMAAIKKRLAVLHAGTLTKYAHDLAPLRREKSFGIVSLSDGEFEVCFDDPKRVDWDQAELAKADEAIRSWGEPIEDYITVERKVSEAAYKAWPGVIKKLFEPARTTKPGKTKITIKRREIAEEAA